MATYPISDLIERLTEMTQDGYSYVDIEELPSDDEYPACLSFLAISDVESIDYETIDSIDDNNLDFTTSRQFSPDDLCSYLLFTYNEISTLHQAIVNVIEYFKEESNKPDCSRDEKAEIKKDLIDFRNLRAKIEKFFKHIKIINI